MPVPDLQLRPAIGYAMWHMSHISGSRAEPDSMADIVERMKLHPEYSRLTSAQALGVASAAAENLAAGEIAKTMDEAFSVGSAFLNYPDQSEKVGVRVLMQGLDSQGNTLNASIVLNVNPDMTVEQIKELAIDTYLADSEQRSDRPSRQMDVVVPSILSVFEGGYENPRATR